MGFPVSGADKEHAVHSRDGESAECSRDSISLGQTKIMPSAPGTGNPLSVRSTPSLELRSNVSGSERGSPENWGLPVLGAEQEQTFVGLANKSYKVGDLMYIGSRVKN